MAFNIFERWPWTSFQNLNLDWLMQAAKEALTKATETSESVGTFDARITQNTNAIEAMSSPARVVVDDALHVTYNGSAVTGEELLTMMRTHGDLPFVEYMSEVYMLDTIRYGNALRFSMCHTYDSPDRLVMRHITIPANSSDAAYSITIEQGGSGGSSDVFTVTITTQNEELVADHTYSEIISQMAAGRTPVFVIKYSTSYVVSSVYDVAADTRIDIYDSPTISDTNGSVRITRYSIYSDNTIGRNNDVTHLASLQNLFDNAVCYTPQELTEAQQALARQNIGIDSLLPAVTAEDNGKFLRVVSGAWAATTVPDAESTSFGP